MRYLAAPWRAPYVKNVHKPAPCVFCAAPKAGDDRAAGILLRGRRAFVILNKYPYQSGHLMVAPLRHIGMYAYHAGFLRRFPLLSVCPLETIEALEARLPEGARVVRSMPNTPATVQAGATAIAVDSTRAPAAGRGFS